MTDEERNLKRRTFIEKYRHEVGGMVMDAVAGNHSTAGGRSGIELAQWSRDRFRQIDDRLGRMFDDLCPAPYKPPAPLTEAEKAKLEAEKKRPK